MNLNDLKQVKIYDYNDSSKIVAVEGNKIYFENGRLFSINTDGTNFKEIKLSNRQPLNFIYEVSNGCIYYGSYIFNEETSLNKLDLLTGKDIVLKKFDKFEYEGHGFGVFDTINIDGEWIYYNDKEHSQIRKMKIDGTNDTVVFTSPCKDCYEDAIYINVAGGWVFTSIWSGEYMIKSDGSSYRILWKNKRRK
jgi:VCBS repeat-containing protein